MALCKHTEWLRLWSKGDRIGLEVTDRPHRLLEDIRDPDGLSPCFLVLIGNQSKRLALTRLRIGNARLCNKRGHGDVHLFVSSARGYKDKPVIIADGDIPVHNRLPTSCRAPRCHETVGENFPSENIAKRAVEVADDVFHRSLFPFADVICIFAQDIGGVESSVRRLTAWWEKGQASSSPIRPRVLLVVNKEEEKGTRIALKEALRAREGTAVTDCLGDISILCLPERSSRTTKRKSGTTATWDIFRHKIFTSLELARKSRQRSNFLFSARHFTQVLQYGADRTTRVLWEPFNFIKASRTHNKIASDLASHIANFVELFRTAAAVKKVAVPLIASSFILDQYPPGMHGGCQRLLFCYLMLTSLSF